MLRKSIIVVIIQIIGVLFSFATLYFVAGDMDPAVYSLVGTYAVILSVVNTFSHLGVETIMMREALYWMGQGENEKVQEYATQSVCSRIFGFGFLFPFLFGYILFLNVTKYNGESLSLLLMFISGSLASSLNDALSLIIRSRGGYVFSQMTRTINFSIIKCIGLILYFIYGAKVYLYFYSLSPIPLLLLLLFYTRNLLSFKYIQFKPMIMKIKESKFLWLRQDLEFFKNYADSLLVSIIFPSFIMGSYSIYKQLEGIAKDFIEGFFDVLSQNMVKYKGQYQILCKEERKFNIIRVAVASLILICVGVFSLYSNEIISLCHMTKYQSVDIMVYCMSFVSLLYLLGKYEINAIAFFGSSKMNFQISVILFIVAIMTFVFVIYIPSIEGALLQRIVIYASASIVSILFYRKHRRIFFENILK